MTNFPTHKIIQADVIAWAESYTGPKFHAILCDPPYHLQSIVARFGKNGASPAKIGFYNRLSLGFMGQQWDGSGQDGAIAFNPETWGLLSELLYPGAFGMAYGGARTFHRMMVAIEDAGLVINPVVGMMGWAYGSGFTSPTRIDTRVDEELKETWQGHRYGADCLKPAFEPIVVFRKAYEGRPLDNITETGAGAINVDGGRIGTEGEVITTRGVPKRDYSGQNPRPWHTSPPIAIPNPRQSRWPNNLILTHAPSCKNGYCVEGCPVRIIGEQSGTRGPNGARNETETKGKGLTKASSGFQNGAAFESYNDIGTAARYFYQADWSYEVAERFHKAPAVYYEAKPSQAEKEAGLEGLTSQLKRRVNAGGLESEERFAPVEAKNIHPTVKPISMSKHLAHLLAPPKEYAPRRLLIPFLGSGTEMIAALLSGGWDEVVGIEQDAEYVEIAQARVAWWADKARWGHMEVDKVLKTADGEQRPGQLALWGSEL